MVNRVGEVHESGTPQYQRGRAPTRPDLGVPTTYANLTPIADREEKTYYNQQRIKYTVRSLAVALTAT